MKRRSGVGIGVAALVAALVWWWSRGEDTPREQRADRVVSAVLGGESARSIEQIDPRTQPRGSITGTVRDEASAPIAGARVCADLSSYELPAELTRDPICTTTDAGGVYTLSDLLAGKYTVVGGARTYLPATYHPDGDRRTSKFPLAAGQAKTGVDLVLRTGGVELTGIVSDVSGGPIAGARVRASAGFWGQFMTSPVVETDEEGAFSIWMRAGQVRVDASAEGYGDASERARAPGTVELLLTPESSLSGIVVDTTSGAPIEDAHVALSTEEAREAHTTRTDAEGRFRVAKLPPGRYVVIARTARGHGRTEGSARVGLGEHVDGVVVTVYPAARITGTVKIVGATPATCTEAQVSFRDNANERFARSRTEADGTVVADGVLPGTYVPRVWCRGWAQREPYAPIVVADEDVTDVVWEVEPGATIRGRVRTRDGAVLEGARVRARSVGGARTAIQWAGDSSSIDGGYVLDGLRAGTYRIDVDSDHGLGPAGGEQVEIAAGQVIERDLVVEPGGRIRGTVVDATGAPVSSVQVHPLALADQQPRVEPARTDHAGAFTLEPLPAGTYQVVAQRGYGEPLRKPGTTDDQQQGEKAIVTVGQTTTVRLVVEPLHGTIRGVVVDADGAPVIDAYVSAARESDAAGAQGRTHATRGWSWGQNKPVLTATDGTFTLEKLAPGSYTVRAYRKGGGEAITEHVAVGTTTRLQIQRTGAIEGIARVEDGSTPDEISVVVRDPKTGFQRDETFLRTGGRFAIHELPAGHLIVTVSSKTGRASVELDLAGGETKRGVTVVLAGLVTLTGRVVVLGTEEPVAGFTMAAQLSQGSSSFGWGSEDRTNVSDASGRFSIARAPKGKIELFGFPKDYPDSDLEILFTVRTITGTGTIDLGDLQAVRKRLKAGQEPGELGVRFKEQAPGTPPDEARLEISYIDPAGPAARSGLVVGDVITSIDGVDVTGANASRATTLMRAPAGTRLALGLLRGATVTVTLASP